MLLADVMSFIFHVCIMLPFSIKIWNLAEPRLVNAIERSFSIGKTVVGLARSQTNGNGTNDMLNREPSFRPITDHFPLFTTNQVHRDYVDSARWAGNLIASKSTKNRIALWGPDPHRYQV